jgi:nucleoid-associated protein YgaU
MPIMRKDLRVGLGIGGVLLAVLVVALVVRSHTRQKTTDAKVAAVDKPDGGDNSSPTPPPDSTGVTSTDPATPTAIVPAAPPVLPPDAAKPPDKDDPFRGEDQKAPPSDWDKILLNGSMPPTTPTVTPTEHGTGRTIGQHFGPTASSPAVTPGTIPPHGISAADTTPHSAAGAVPPAHGQRTHVIAEGETLSTIARTAYGSKKYYLLIEKANPNIVAERLRPGTTIVLPDLPASEHADHHAAHGSAASTAAVDSSTQYVVKANDSLYRISMRLYGTANKVDALYDLNKELIGPDRGRLKLGMTLKLPSPPTSGSR